MEITDIIPEEPSSGLNTPEKPEETDELEELEELEITEASEDAEPEELPRFTAPRRLRPEAIMGIIALVSAVILTLTVILCLPYIRGTDQDPSPAPIQTDPAAEEDPELPYREQQNGEEEPLPTIEPIIEPEATLTAGGISSTTKTTISTACGRTATPALTYPPSRGTLTGPG